MKIIRHVGERLFAWATSTVALVKNVGLVEAIKAPRFRFDYELVGPRECDRARYVTLRDRIEDLRPCVDQSSRNLLRVLREQLAAIPLERKWSMCFYNTVVTVGKNHILDTEFAGSSYTAAWFLGLIDLTSFSAIAAGDTMASHAGWLESTAYSQANRVALAFSAASGGSKATSAASSFSINATATIKGGFVTTNNTKSGTTGTLYSAGLFTGGDRAVSNGDTLNCSLTVSV